MSLAILVPVKSSGSKSRLSDVLQSSERAMLAELLLRGVLSVIQKAGLIRSTYVVSSDAKALRLTKRLGARIVTEPSDAGVNAAVARGLRVVRTDDVLVIPSDLPLLRPVDLRRLLSLKRAGLDVLIAPSNAFDGTNALLFPARSPFPLSYDNNSFWNHLAGAARNRLSLAVCTEPGLMFDVDSWDDLRSLAKSKVKNPSVGFAKKALA